MAKRKPMKAAELDRMHDAGQDISECLDMTQARRPGLEPRRVNVDFPQWMIESLDRHSSRFGVTRQAVIKMWIAERLKEETSPPMHE